MVLLTSLLPPTEGIKHEQPSTKLYISDRDLGCGTLYITESKLSWRDSSGEGISLLYPHIAVHAVSRDVQQFGSECLILMIDTRLDDNNDDDDDDDDGDDDEGGGMTELRFVPEDKSQLDAMYRAMTFCQSQHPDPTSDSLSEVSEEEFVDADDERIVWEGGDSVYLNGHDGYRANELRAMNGLRISQQGEEEMETDGQFEDAEDD